MLRTYLILILSLACLSSGLHAQVLLRADEFTPRSGDRYILHTIDYVDPGKEVIWDLSEVDIRSSNAVEVLPAAESPFADTFRSSSLCYDLGRDEYMYFSKDATGFYNTGGVTEGSQVVYQDSRLMLPLPLQVGEVKSDEYRSTFRVEGVEFSRKGEMEIRVLGEGTAIFPFGIMDEVIKIHSIERITDEYMVMGEKASIHSESESHYFLSKGSNEFIMSLHIQSQEGKELRRYGTLMDKGELQSLLVMDAPVRAIHTYHESPDNALHLKMISEWTGRLHLSLQDLQGKTVMEDLAMDVVPGKVETDIAWQHLSPGTYVMNLELDDRLSQLKVVKD